MDLDGCKVTSASRDVQNKYSLANDAITPVCGHHVTARMDVFGERAGCIAARSSHGWMHRESRPSGDASSVPFLASYVFQDPSAGGPRPSFPSRGCFFFLLPSASFTFSHFFNFARRALSSCSRKYSLECGEQTCHFGPV